MDSSGSVGEDNFRTMMQVTCHLNQEVFLCCDVIYVDTFREATCFMKEGYVPSHSVIYLVTHVLFGIQIELN